MNALKINFPEDFFREEVRCGYTVTSEMKKIWAVELDLLNEFSNVCKKYDIKWFADAGTLLGAVRHQGMIPWDDDIDVVLMRSEYDKLCKIAPVEFKAPFFFQTEYTDKGSLRCHAQLRNSNTTGILKNDLKHKYKFNQGIFIDVFPIDVKTNDEKRFEEQCEELKKIKSEICRRQRHKDANPFGYRGNVFKFLGNAVRYFLANTFLRKRFDYEELSRKFDETSTMYNAEDSEYLCFLCLPPVNARKIWKKKWYEKSVYMKFEMLSIPVPIGWEDYLNTVYGNWKEFVKGTSAHGGVFFDTEKSYLNYIK